ncbi:hypothetical protein [Levilactobacillus humaensis]|uniref:hypothetical protein n=1 Tax=Levilactobacillus humaensis TaxID=2950375 RepID=UPI0021C26E3E|nr:hypothetical protein [Levilactobacillus humaensis]
MSSEEWVTTWLRLCEKHAVKPWEFDFKQFYLLALMTPETSHLDLWLDYKREVLEEPRPNVFTTPLAVVDHDPDKVAGPIYDELGWPNDENVKGDTMNSFKTTFTQTIRAMSEADRNEIYQKIGIDADEKLDRQYGRLLSDKNFGEFPIIAENFDQIERFAQLTQAIGNFWTLDAETNQFRGTNAGIRDYFDITLSQLKGKRRSEEWSKFIKQYFLQPYVYQGSGQVGELWQDHFKHGVYPKTSQDFKQFYTNANLMIEERGKWLTKRLCEDLGLTNLAFYQEDLANMTKIKYFDQIKGIMR